MLGTSNHGYLKNAITQKFKILVKVSFYNRAYKLVYFTLKSDN